MSVLFFRLYGQCDARFGAAVPQQFECLVARYDLLCDVIVCLKAVGHPGYVMTVVNTSTTARAYYANPATTPCSLADHLRISVVEDPTVVTADVLATSGDSSGAQQQAHEFHGAGAPIIAPDSAIMLEHECVSNTDVVAATTANTKAGVARLLPSVGPPPSVVGAGD